MITAAQLKQVFTAAPMSRLEAAVPHLIKTMEEFEINTPLRMCHFLAQVGHESGQFLYMEEIASGKAYEGRKDLGNTNPGDGIRFKGRGVIQITGRVNYEMVGKALGYDFIANPKALSEPQFAFRSGGWYWKNRGLNAWADVDDVKQVTRRINGGFNGLEERTAYLNGFKKIIKI